MYKNSSCRNILFSGFFCFFLDGCLGEWSQQMWLVSCRRQGMLVQGPAPDTKCELNITFLTLSHPLHCPICAKDIMVTVLLLQVMGEGKGEERWEGQGVVHLRQCLGRETGVGIIFFLFFVLLLIVLSWLVHDSLLCLFHCSFLAFFVSGPFNQALLENGNCCVCFVKLFQESGF